MTAAAMTGHPGVVLVHVPGGQQPDPRAELGLHVQDPLAGGHQLLGQQVARAARPLNGPGPLRQTRDRPGLVTDARGRLGCDRGCRG